MQIKTVSLLNQPYPLNLYGRVRLLIELLVDRDMLPSTATIHYVSTVWEPGYYEVCGVNVGTNEQHIVSMVMRMSQEFVAQGYLSSFYK